MAVLNPMMYQTCNVGSVLVQDAKIFFYCREMMQYEVLKYKVDSFKYDHDIRVRS